ncbi:acetylornithine transaminase [Siculibacillus lacustris]|uniref:Acetylornithine aminotransferase n=1 Tax=Siculibacillus lacustris TaxID=1549641 RepID=A0A4Q9VTT7_9HYPH|nr:acetylornithine transaminase [Siculibacillus lacustris]TBW39511.1 acetylornithine transaminase [Siculibacillus lacustris]
MTAHPIALSPFPPSDALMDIGPKPPVVFVEGRGSRLIDRDGKSYLDFVQGWAVNALGHCPPEIVDTLARQAARLINCSPAFHNGPQLDLAARLAAVSGLDSVFFANSGAEANEGAIKLARKWGGKFRAGAHEIVTFRDGFHGRTLATMSASGKEKWDGLFEPRVPGFPKATLNDLASVERCLGPATVAVMLEPIQGEAGVVVADDDFLRALRALTTRRGLLLIFDEVQTGMGRTGKMFGFEHAGVRPDIMTLGKGLGGGVPIAALLADRAVCCFEPGDQGGTFNGNPLMTAVADAVVATIAAPDFLARVTKAGELLQRHLTRIADARLGGGEVRGRGLLRALDLGCDIAPAVVDEALRRGLLLNAPRPHLLRFMPALNVTDAEIAEMADGLDAVLRDILGGRAARGA